MSDIAIQIENLSKRYRYGSATPLSHNLRADIADWVKGLFRRNSNYHPTLQEVHEKHIAESPEYFWALKDVNLEIKQGEVVGIIGRNGAGKSTLLKILSRITPPTSGKITYRGRVSSLLEVGTGFHRELTGRENIFLNGSILGMRRTEIARKFDEIVAFAEVEKFLDTPVKFYSSGMYVRLAFAVAAHLEPEILVVDEVLAVGDVSFQQKCLGKMGDVARQGRTVLFVSHNMGAINDLCGRCILLDSGRVERDEATDKVIQAYLSHGDAAAHTVELKPTKSGAYFTKLGLQNADGKPSTRFDVKKPITALLRFNLDRGIQALEVGLAVFNHKAERIFYSSNAYAEPPLLIERAGDHRLSVQIPGKLLLPGSYSISVALHRPNVQMYDYREHVLRFDVEETGSGRYGYTAQAMGYVYVDLKWENGKTDF